MAGNITVKKIGITELDVDAIVNAANSSLSHGGGVCGAVFRDAGAEELSDACSKIGGCRTGEAVITSGFNLKARYIIHAVGPIWSGGSDNEEKLLYGAYANSLALGRDNGCASIAFPVISSGIYGYPKSEAWKVAVESCRDFIRDNPDYDIEIIFAVLSDESKRMGDKTIAEVMNDIHS